MLEGYGRKNEREFMYPDLSGSIVILSAAKYLGSCVMK